MIKTVRAAAFAATTFLFAALVMVGGPTALLSAAAAAEPVPFYIEQNVAQQAVQAIAPVPAASSPSVRAFSQAATAQASVPAIQLAPLQLDLLVAAQEDVQASGDEQNCLANAVYFEARGEPLQGQLAVAEVVMNRAASGRFPPTLCGVVVQHAQFSFVRGGHIPQADHASQAWRRAVGIARIAMAGMTARALPATCLWYHANYVSPSWGRNRPPSARIGAHIFYS